MKNLHISQNTTLLAKRAHSDLPSPPTFTASQHGCQPAGAVIEMHRPTGLHGSVYAAAE